MLKTDDSVDFKTNQIINKTLNYYSSILTTDNTVIFHQQDDTISLICFTLLKMLQNNIHFTLYLYGKHRNTGKMYGKNHKFISKWKTKKLLKSKNSILVTPYNPIYKVSKSEKIFNQFSANNVINIVKKFNYNELVTAQLFYHIPYLKNDELQYSNFEKADKNLYDLIMKEAYLDYNNKELLPYENDCYAGTDIYCVWLTGDYEEDCRTINQIEKIDDLVFYYYDKENKRPEILDSKFEFWLSNSINSPVENININIEEDMSKITNRSIITIGNFPDELKKKIKGEV